MPTAAVSPQVEQAVWKVVSSNPDLTAKVLGKKMEDITPRQMVEALNSLLSKDLVKAYKSSDGGLLWKAVNKADAKVRNAMAGDERMVYGAIEASGNQGVWSRSIQTSTNLPNAVVTKVLTKLVNSKQIKMVKSVKHPTRKMYMLSHIEPSVDLTGGPWYTDFELDVEFIRTIKNACLKFIQTQSFPDPDDTSPTAPLYSGSKTSIYPTTSDVAKWLRKSRITEQELAPDHVQEILDVLIYDGEIEKLPAFSGGDDSNGRAGDVEEEVSSKTKKKSSKTGKKRKRKQSSDESSSEEESRKRDKRRKKLISMKEVDTMSSGDDSDDSNSPTTKKRSSSKSKRRSRNGSDDDASDSEPNSSKHKKSRSKKTTHSETEDESSDDPKAGKSKHGGSRSTLSSSSESDSEVDTSKRKSNKSKSRSKTPSKSKGKQNDAGSDVDYDLAFGHIFGGDNVYRAVRPERVGLGWSQAPCGRCPQLEFCEDDGPVNPKGCKYYKDWLLQGVEE